MTQFFINGLLTTLLYLLPLVLLPGVAVPLYRLMANRRRMRSAPAELELFRLNYNIARYLVYLLIAPIILLVTSVLVGFAGGTAAILDSIIWLVAAITVSLGWCVYRLVSFVSARTRLEQQAQPAGPART